MKITHLEKSKQPTPTLRDLKAGAVFRPINNSTVYIACDMDAECPLLSSSCGDLWKYFFDLQDDFNYDRDLFGENHDYDELYVCVQLTTGKVVLLWNGIEVEELDCELMVKEKR